ncbi:type VI secretion system-associated protein TagF [Vibrio hyugaensis]|uniref:type VI secretion system-associated protein TagF n=1 Tax=Vibrio hyugaensis TaxID=1534743 RepID=UPI000CE30AD3|nr:type VI secretion system-associated protein TagF [Vibrio hyugaensis]
MSADLISPSWGYIGKMPAKGDFVKQGLSQSFTSRWHDWQQAIIAVSREQLGEGWGDYFLTAPVWHFALDASYMEDATYIGSMIPSVDASGRYFFFTIARPVKGDATQYWAIRAWEQESQDLALAVLDDAFVFDEWTQNLNRHSDILSKSHVEELLVSETYNSELSTVFSLSEALSANALLSFLVKKENKAPCFWWTEGSSNVEPCMFVSSGLPSIGQFSAMLDGQWQKWNW